jgi:hypothetical protein
LELKSSHFFLFTLNVPNFNAKLWSTREKKHPIAPKFGTELWSAERKKPLNVPKFDIEHWSSKRFFELWRVERKRNLSTFQSFAPNFEASKVF